MITSTLILTKNIKQRKTEYFLFSLYDKPKNQ